MRILIGNSDDDLVFPRTDHRAWAQRILWLAGDGDTVVLPCAPDAAFLGHLAGLTGVDPSSLDIHVPPPAGSATGASTRAASSTRPSSPGWPAGSAR
ncbi:hypothetical protein [Streptomyces sp. 1331.2]|uniref:preATP grasp domain-containing protein n=1 Tax=Streptomyces sp. 1331.2 TaxID=1938835 RepID=UPI000BE448E8|nr:hypothetical protein [Streptomyces sp. 1331.2]